MSRAFFVAVIRNIFSNWSKKKCISHIVNLVCGKEREREELQKQEKKINLMLLIIIIKMIQCSTHKTRPQAESNQLTNKSLEIKTLFSNSKLDRIIKNFNILNK